MSVLDITLFMLLMFLFHIACDPFSKGVHLLFLFVVFIVPGMKDTKDIIERNTMRFSESESRRDNF